MGSWWTPWPAQENTAVMAGPSDRAEIQGRTSVPGRVWSKPEAMGTAGYRSPGNYTVSS